MSFSMEFTNSLENNTSIYTTVFYFKLVLRLKCLDNEYKFAKHEKCRTMFGLS